jgi:hypothetical protein
MLNRKCTLHRANVYKTSGAPTFTQAHFGPGRTNRLVKKPTAMRQGLQEPLALITVLEYTRIMLDLDASSRKGRRRCTAGETVQQEREEALHRWRDRRAPLPRLRGELAAGVTPVHRLLPLERADLGGFHVF